MKTEWSDPKKIYYCPKCGYRLVKRISSMFNKGIPVGVLTGVYCAKCKVWLPASKKVLVKVE